ncbi:MAG: zinc-binding dehydrogenase [Clostridiales bacterium]|jgi:2-desacetyl-2-hydroxyethyl bacteriochlorophyllide A dehydrogenase|nr:zinc-binding dehydrogenase [Clostridiales bacterium]
MMRNLLGRVASPGTVDFIERDMPPAPPGHVTVQIRMSAICGSDLHIFKGKHPSVALPATIGHEFSGVVCALGDGVGALSMGDRVTAEPVISCGLCDACRHGDYGYCENISFTYRNGDGALARYITMPACRVFALPDCLGFKAGALTEPLAVAAHAVRRADIQMDDRVVVIGSGAIGILVAALCKRRGASRVAVSDVNPERLKLARAFGADETFGPKSGLLPDAIRRWSGGQGADKSFECVGMEETFRQAMLCLRKNGLATVVGIFEQSEISVPAARFVTHEIRVQGSQGYCWDFPAALRMAQELPLEKLITHIFPLNKLQEALDTCLDKESNAVKVLLRPDSEESP